MSQKYVAVTIYLLLKKKFVDKTSQSQVFYYIMLKIIMCTNDGQLIVTTAPDYFVHQKII